MNLTAQQKATIKTLGLVSGLIQLGLAYYFWQDRPHLAGFFLSGAMIAPFAGHIVENQTTHYPSMPKASPSIDRADVLLQSITGGEA